MALTKEEKAILQDIKDDQTEIKTVLLGVPNTDDRGLVGDVKALAEGHGKLKRNFWTLVGILIGSGIIGSGIYGLFGGG